VGEVVAFFRRFSLLLHLPGYRPARTSCDIPLWGGGGSRTFSPLRRIPSFSEYTGEKRGGIRSHPALIRLPLCCGSPRSSPLGGRGPTSVPALATFLYARTPGA